MGEARGAAPKGDGADDVMEAKVVRRTDRGTLVRLAIGTVVIVGAMFVFVFPTSALVDQHNTINDTQHRFDILKQENASLATESNRLQQGGEVERIARERYGMVRPGEQAWVVVPTATSTTTSTPPAQRPARPAAGKTAGQAGSTRTSTSTQP